MSQGEEGRGAEKWKEERRLVFVESDEARNTRGRVERLYLVERMRRGGYDHNNYRYLGILDNKRMSLEPPPQYTTSTPPKTPHLPQQRSKIDSNKVKIV